jgi:hypothetical protein
MRMEGMSEQMRRERMRDQMRRRGIRGNAIMCEEEGYQRECDIT